MSDQKRIAFRHSTLCEAMAFTSRRAMIFGDRRFLRLISSEGEYFDITDNVFDNSNVLLSSLENCVATTAKEEEFDKENVPMSPMTRSKSQKRRGPCLEKPVDLPFRAHIIHAAIFFMGCTKQERETAGFPVEDLLEIYEIGDYLDMPKLRSEVLELIEEMTCKLTGDTGEDDEKDEDVEPAGLEELRRIWKPSGDCIDEQDEEVMVIETPITFQSAEPDEDDNFVLPPLPDNPPAQAPSHPTARRVIPLD